MNLHEYQAQKLMEGYGIPCPPGKPAFSIREANRNADELGGNQWVVKAQVHAGGRGKAGGVKLVEGRTELEECVRGMLGTRLVTRQSAPDGQPVHCVLIQGKAEIARELYLGMLVDRSRRRVVAVASSAGGMDIEEVAAQTPEQIHTMAIEPALGLQPHQCRQIGFALDLDARQRSQLSQLLQAMYRMFQEKDLTLVEINPLILNKAGELQALDAKLSIDDNALFRQSTLAEWKDPSQEDEREAAAKRFDLNYVAMDGNIGCMVNGAGLAMATMDIIKLHGGNPANFLDVGGGATVERVSEACKIITGDPGVKAILVNIFGGIVRCDLIAQGIIEAVSQIGIQVPIVVRLEGTQVQEGRRLLEQSGLRITAAQNLDDAATQAVRAAIT